MELEQSRPEYEKRGIGVAAVSYDSTAILHDFAQRRGIHYPLLSDPESKIIRSAGLLNESVPAGTPFHGIPHPGTLVLDGRGIIVAKYFEEDFRQRYTAANILTRQFGQTGGTRAAEVHGKQLNAVTSASNEVVRGGQRLALELDLTLLPKMHVYAPGVQGYIPIEWKMNASTAYTAHEVSFPKPETLFLKAIDEKVPVYEGHVRLLRDITLAAQPAVKPLAAADGTLTVEGSLRYQACDDRMCYIPQELPLKWTFRLQSHDVERAPEPLRRK